MAEPISIVYCIKYPPTDIHIGKNQKKEIQFKIRNSYSEKWGVFHLKIKTLQATFGAIDLISYTKIKPGLRPNEEIPIKTTIRGVKEGTFVITWTLLGTEEYCE